MAEDLAAIEARTRKVEEAVIKFEYIADTMLVNLESRVATLEEHDEEFRTIIYQSCDVKTKEIASGDNNVLVKAFAGIVLLFGLFVGGMGYMNGEHGNIHEKINGVDKNVVANGTNIKHMMHLLDQLNAKMDVAAVQKAKP